VRSDPLSHPGLGGREVVEAGLRERREDPVLHRPVRDEQQEAGIQLVGRGVDVGGHGIPS
jgi:hypothetical protein